MLKSAPRQATAQKRVVLVTELFPPDIGGSSVLFGNLYGRLRGEQVTVIRHGADATTPRCHGTIQICQVPMTAPEWGVTNFRSLRRYSDTVRSIVRECRSEPAVVHCGKSLHEGFSALCAARLTGVPYVCWAHGEELQLARSSRELLFLMRMVLRGASALLANSHNTARELAAHGVPAHKIHVIHPGVDADAFRPSPQAAEIRRRYVGEHEVLMLTVGRLQARKGHDLAIEALARGAHDLAHVKYLIVGDGDERTRLERLVAERGLAGRVHFTGAVAEAALRDYYGAADFFVHPNRRDGGDFEGFGIVFLEAAAAGLATVGGNTGGVPEAIGEGTTGLLVSGTDADELTGAIRTLATSEFTRRKFGAAGRTRVQQHFTWDRAAAQLLAVHHELATSRDTRMKGTSRS